MLNLLFITKDTSNLIFKNYFYLEKELKKLTNLMIWKESGNIKDILEKLPARPDFILILNDIGGFGPIVDGLEETEIPAGLFINDVHRLRMRDSYIKKNNIQYLFSVVRERFYKEYPFYKDRFIWFPHFINPAIIRDYKLSKENDMLMLGVITNLYPLRKIIKNYYNNNQGFVYKMHPGYRNFSNQEQNELLLGENYAKEINKAKIFFTDPSTLEYPVLKYFEVPACKTLLMAPTFPELEDLGFIPGVHFVPITENDFSSKAQYYLENEQLRNKIIEQGYNFILNNHTIQIRARQLVDKIEEIISTN
ncbi:glycosyltransferase [Pontibacillus marinus]|uniref:Spore protein YkvP/CgeB glycosyl transferase-like domain-containing protein n=1 Tax=Pontibacillus marinus BH030004 = DSM 16465 TaxID=1385511 RepID=A0A0A5GDH6_9BACI|nr:glycosyltransferase [Pontibacillus marinus]KGX89268.1 hypothetical protein N783_07175 [Pontibacillus marinus BH030004 = DSM 16465]